LKKDSCIVGAGWDDWVDVAAVLELLMTVVEEEALEVRESVTGSDLGLVLGVFEAGVVLLAIGGMERVTFSEGAGSATVLPVVATGSSFGEARTVFRSWRISEMLA
jgi:hypothetical protein